MKVVLFSLLILVGFYSPAHAQSEISVTAGMQSCMKHADCGLVATSCLQACSYTPVNTAAINNLNARYRDYCGFEAAERPKCNITPPLEATCHQNRCTLVQARQMGGYTGDRSTYSAATTAPRSPTPLKPADAPRDKSGYFTAYDLPQSIVNQNVMGQYRFEQPQDIQPAAGN